MPALRLLGIVAPCMAESLAPRLATALPGLCACMRAPQSDIRNAAVAAAAAIMATHHQALLPRLLEHVVPMLDGQGSGGGHARQGSIAAGQAVAQALGPSLAPYCLLLTMPVLKRMSDSAEGVRQAAAQVPAWWSMLTHNYHMGAGAARKLVSMGVVDGCRRCGTNTSCIGVCDHRAAAAACPRHGTPPKPDPGAARGVAAGPVLSGKPARQPQRRPPAAAVYAQRGAAPLPAGGHQLAGLFAALWPARHPGGRLTRLCVCACMLSCMLVVAPFVPKCIHRGALH